MTCYSVAQRSDARAAQAATRLCRAILRTLLSALLAFVFTGASPVLAQIYNYQTGQIIPGTQGITLGPGVDLSGWNTAGHQLEFAGLGSIDLSNATFETSDVSNASFNNSTLTNANFGGAVVMGAHFSGSMVMGTNFSGSGITASQLYSTASFASGNLTGINLGGLNLNGWNFANENLTNASFTPAPYRLVPNPTLANANFSGAIVKGASFVGIGGFTSSHLYSTASYASGDLAGIELGAVSGWNFANQNLTGVRIMGAPENLTADNFANANLTNASLSGEALLGVNFSGANLENAVIRAEVVGGTTKTNFSDADLRGADFIIEFNFAVMQNSIGFDGSIQGLALQAGEKLVIRNNPIAITVDTTATIDNAATPAFLLDDDNWTSPVGFAPGLIPELGGTLDLGFAPGVDPANLLGESFQLFDWNGALPVGDQFATITTDPGLTFDLSNLYTTGAVTLTAVPEPSSLALCLLATGALLPLARRRMRAL